MPVADALAIRSAVPVGVETVQWRGWGWGLGAGFVAGAVVGSALARPGLWTARAGLRSSCGWRSRGLLQAAIQVLRFRHRNLSRLRRRSAPVPLIARSDRERAARSGPFLQVTRQPKAMAGRGIASGWNQCDELATPHGASCYVRAHPFMPAGSPRPANPIALLCLHSLG
jgi:hypothetical protein